MFVRGRTDKLEPGRPAGAEAQTPIIQASRDSKHFHSGRGCILGELIQPGPNLECRVRNHRQTTSTHCGPFARTPEGSCMRQAFLKCNLVPTKSRTILSLPLPTIFCRPQLLVASPDFSGVSITWRVRPS